MPKIIIAVDGPSASGKSTLSKKLADKLNYKHIDTGAMYRAVAYHIYKNKLFNPQTLAVDEVQILKDLPTLEINFEKNTEQIYTIHVNGQDVEPFIRSEAISRLVSKTAKLPFVREALTKQQRLIGKDKGLVMDGRDIGSIVFPQAELKFYVTANAETRADRRYEQLKQKQSDISYQQILQDIIRRDEEDTSRTHAPLIKMPDAIEIDNTTKSIEEQVEKMYTQAMQHIA